MTVKQFVKQNEKTGEFVLKSFAVKIEGTSTKSITVNDVEFNLEDNSLSPNTVTEKFFTEYALYSFIRTKNEERRYLVQLKITINHLFVEIHKR